MADAGELVLEVIWDGAFVTGVEIRSSRPRASALLRGRTPDEVSLIVPLLFGVCGRAQESAANAALHAAQQLAWPEMVRAERQVTCEAQQEHLWRLLLDWPTALGLPQQEHHFVAWHALLRDIAAGTGDMVELRKQFERDWLGMTVAEWRGLVELQALQDWWRARGSPAAQLLERLAGTVAAWPAPALPRLLPSWSAAEAEQACRGSWSAAFAAHPHWQGRAAEAGAWSYHAASPLLRDAQRQGASPALLRLLARLCDVVEMLKEPAASRLDAATVAPEEGMAVVRTARGVLMHHVRMREGRVADYAIVAPTEWNFHPAGPFAQDLQGVVERDAGQLLQLARLEALSLDPCVVYRIEVRHA